MSQLFYHLFYWSVAVICTLLHFAFGFFCFFTFHPQINHRKLARFFIRIISKAMKLHINVTGIANIPKNEACIIMANHTSLIDILVMMMAIPYHFNFIAKKELFWVPIIGFDLLFEGDFFIDRHNPKKAKECIKKVENAVKKGQNILIFPEGTRSTIGGLLPFKRGGFKLAATTNATIIPCHIHGSNKIVKKKSLKATPGTVHVKFLAPIIPPSIIEKTTIEELKQKTFDEINQQDIKLSLK